MRNLSYIIELRRDTYQLTSSGICPFLGGRVTQRVTQTNQCLCGKRGNLVRLEAIETIRRKLVNMILWSKGEVIVTIVDIIVFSVTASSEVEPLRSGACHRAAF